MVGLLGYALAGAAKGYGEGIAEQARAASDAALATLREEWRREDMATTQQNKLDLKATPAARAGGGGGGHSGGGSRPAKASAGTSGTKLYGWEVGEDGIAYGRNRNTGQLEPYKGPDGKPWRASVKGSKARVSAPAEINTPPAAMTDAPAMERPSSGSGPAVGAVVEGHRFLGGDPNDMKSWEPVS